MAFTRTDLMETRLARLVKVGEIFVWSWTADGSGNVTEDFPVRLEGWISLLMTKPGSPTPTSYGLVVNRKTGFTTLDVLGGAAAGRSTSAQEVLPEPNSGITLLCEVNGLYSASISGAGNGGQGTAEFHVRLE